MTSQNEVPLSREKRLKIWMFERDIKYTHIAERVGCTAQRARAALNSENITQETWNKYAAIGIPHDLLPSAFVKRREMPEPKFPIVEEKEASA